VHGWYDRARARNYAYVPMHGTNPSRDRANQNQSASHTFIRACMLTRHGGHDAAASTSGQAPSTSKPGSTESCLDPSPWKRKSPQPFRLTNGQPDPGPGKGSHSRVCARSERRVFSTESVSRRAVAAPAWAHYLKKTHG